MGLDERYKETTACLKIRHPCPFVDQFMNYCEPCEEKKITVDDLYMEYMSFVERIVGSEGLHEPELIPDEIKISSIFRFSKRFAYLAPSHQIRQQCTIQRGYMCKVLPLPREPRPMPDKQVLRKSKRQKVTVSVDEPVNLPYKILDCQGKKGFGAFASRNLDAGTIITEYMGQRLPYKVGKSKDEEYEEDGIPMTMITVIQASKLYCIDGQTDNDGRKFEDGENPAWYFNHKRYNPNSALKMIDDKAYLITRRPVAAGIELRWNYQTKGGKKAEPWEME